MYLQDTRTYFCLFLHCAKFEQLLPLLMLFVERKTSAQKCVDTISNTLFCPAAGMRVCWCVYVTHCCVSMCVCVLDIPAATATATVCAICKFLYIICLSSQLSQGPSLCPPLYLSLSVTLSLSFLSARLSVCLSVCLSVYLSCCLTTHDNRKSCRCFFPSISFFFSGFCFCCIFLYLWLYLSLLLSVCA